MCVLDFLGHLPSIWLLSKLGKSNEKRNWPIWLCVIFRSSIFSRCFSSLKIYWFFFFVKLWNLGCHWWLMHVFGFPCTKIEEMKRNETKILQPCVLCYLRSSGVTRLFLSIFIDFSFSFFCKTFRWRKKPKLTCSSCYFL